MKDREFLYWIRDRLVNHYGESPNVDFVQRLTAIAATTEVEKYSPICFTNAPAQVLVQPRVSRKLPDDDTKYWP